MNKSIKFLFLLAIAALSLTSCNKKEEVLLTPSYSYHLNANETYIFTLPTNTDDEFVISTNPSHASINLLGLDSAGNKIYTYKPALDYTGTDHIVLSTVEGMHPKGPHPKGPKANQNNPNHPKGNCHSEENENDYVITIDFIIDPVVLQVNTNTTNNLEK